MNIAIFGTGYAGIVAIDAFAEVAKDVFSVTNFSITDILTRCIAPVYEPSLEVLFHQSRNQISFSPIIGQQNIRSVPH